MDIREQLRDSKTEWYPAPPGDPLLKRWLQGDDSGAVMVKQNSKRTVYALSETDGAPPKYYLKLDHPRGVRDKLKGLVRSKVKWEYAATKALHDAEVPVVEPVAAAWQGLQGLFVSRAVPDAVSADDLWHEVKQSPARRQAYLNGLKALIVVLLEKNVRHPDFHLGNVIGTEEQNQTKFRLVDVVGVSCAGRLSERQVENVLLIASPLRTRLSATERKELLQDLPKLPAGKSTEQLWRRIAKANVREFYQRWPKRRRKLLHGAGPACATRTYAGRWFLLEGDSAELGDRVVVAHQEVRTNRPDELLKNSRKRCVSKVDVDHESFVVKEFRRPGPWGKFAPDARSWVFCYGLAHCGFRVPICKGWLRSASGAGYLVYEYIPGETLANLFLAGRATVEIYEKIYDFIREMYLWRIEHEDLKLTNFIFHEDKLWLVDNDSVLFDRRIGRKQWERHRRHLLRGAADAPEVAAFAEWLNTQPPPYRDL